MSSINCSKPIWYLWKNESKTSQIISPALAPIMNVSEILHGMKLSFIVRKVFSLPNVLRSSIISCRYGLMFLRYCSIDSFSLPSLLHWLYLSYLSFIST